MTDPTESTDDADAGSGTPEHCFEPIGVVETPFESPAAAPRQGGLVGNADPVAGELVLAERYARGLDGLDAGTVVDVLWVADDADRSTLAVRGGDRGVFASRSPSRPNPVCVTPCRIEAVDPPRLSVSGVDMVDGSPILDLKVSFGLP